MQSLTLEIPDVLRRFADDECRRRGLNAPQDLFVALLEDAKEEQSRKQLERALLESLEGGPDFVATPQFWSDLRAEALSRTH
jgi:antitoxin ParD1/3/4